MHILIPNPVTYEITSVTHYPRPAPSKDLPYTNGSNTWSPQILLISATTATNFKNHTAYYSMGHSSSIFVDAQEVPSSPPSSPPPPDIRNISSFFTTAHPSLAPKKIILRSYYSAKSHSNHSTNEFSGLVHTHHIKITSIVTSRTLPYFLIFLFLHRTLKYDATVFVYFL